ncbi:tRNA pseudouridine(55) synthase TruB [Arenimonas sp.]|uniref:tRNA pseudouridine(55) synthase TruB n=1 Tax=Arenimonas sp. TaxID=1872635 RepID=UPI0039E38F6E
MNARPRTVFRALDGILLLDKPAGISSNQALQRVRHLFRADKAGHTGSLDPLATGLLPLCFGEATKIAGHLLGNDKAYETVARFGLTTDTDDADGKPLRERAVDAVVADRLVSLLEPLTGRIRQRPPIYSALKQGGEPLYAKARRGETIEVPEREVMVHSIELLELRADEARLRIVCGSGTYVRSLVRDLGEALGCGAHVAELRRLWVEPFREPRMFTIEALQAMDEAGREHCLLPVEAGLAGWRTLVLEPEQAQRLGQGQGVAMAGEVQGKVQVTDSQGRSLGLAEIGPDAILRAKRLFRWAARN